MKWFVALVGAALVAASFVLGGYGPTVTDSGYTIQCGSKRQGQAEARQQDLINSVQGDRTNLYGGLRGAGGVLRSSPLGIVGGGRIDYPRGIGLQGEECLTY